MDLRQLRYFVVLAEELHFRRAAERLNITQAPLSVAIQTLERELGGQLFHRTQRRVALTEIGIAFREHAHGVLDRVDRTLADVREMVSGNLGQLRIGFTAASSLLSFFPHMICAFRLKYPLVQVTLRDISSAGQIAALHDRKIDVGIIRSHTAQHVSDISFTRLIRDPLVVAMHADNPLSRRGAVAVADLRDEPFIFYPPKSGIGIYEQFMNLCAKSGFSPTVVQEALDSTTIVGLASTGLGVAVVPSELRCISVPNVVFVPISDPEAVTEILLASRAGERSALVASFRHMVQGSLPAWKRDNPPSSMARPRAVPDPERHEEALA